MKKHPVHGKIIKDFKRPSPEIIEGFKKHDPAKVADSMGRTGIVHHEIKPIISDTHLAGPAFTIWTRPGDTLFVQAGIDLIKPGDVVVIDAEGHKDLSCLGERLVYFYKLKGAVGIIVDGAVRDVRGIREIGLPVFARSITVKLFGSQGPGAINVPVQLGGVIIHPGDIIVADDDGVVCIPQESAPEVLKLTDLYLEQELVRVAEIESGKSVWECFGIEEKLKAWK